jgi:4-hydroxybenzoate polyprenyltransferase
MSNFKPLCVDLDHTFVKTDLLHETFVHSVKQNPMTILYSILWLMKGRSYLKKKLSDISNFNIDCLPLNQEVFDYCKEESEKGREVYLVSASSEKIIDQFLKKYSFFNDGWGSSESLNLKGKNKADFLINKFGDNGYDYIGDCKADMAVWDKADKSLLVSYNGANFSEIDFLKVFRNHRNSYSNIFKTLRPHQYAKNILLFGALILSHQYFNTLALQSSIISFISFSLIASSIYILNDISDLSSDRNHKTKKSRPIPSGDVTLPLVIALGLLCNGTGIALSLLLPFKFTIAIFFYIFLNILYSYFLKKLPVFDVILLSAFYMIRLQAGGFATDIYISHWLITFSLFIFLSLGFLKRYSELFDLFHSQGLSSSKGRGYEVSDLNIILMFGVGTAQLSTLSMILYLFSPNAAKYYQNPKVLFLNAVIIFYWISLMWFKGSKGKVNQDPVKYAITDKTSIMCGACIVLTLLMGKYLPVL